ncbi:HAD family hydrolase [Mangrovibacterium diazotrophicum]|uniref:phosphoglycolate phosphatase n=1 Tax=Mangrovibacterium diazotrophicum TaxID=1261403 RepID=A0A419VWT1_9BACT|nr:HAD family hydrolase [Mangrovibacterium diazotrophicum]RKD87692.1 phosphoglycolate phosphatase [Mangrovibacterium diazotrophicum]
MKFKAVIFDLDGTLLDTLDDLADAVNVVMAKYGFPKHDRAAVRSFVGSGLRSLMQRSLPENERTEEMIDRCFAEMMVVYRENYKDKTVPYDGILELLNWMSDQNLPMAVFSNKADALTKGLVEDKLHYNFAAVRGMTTEELKKPNPTIALEIAKTMGMKPEECLYVGDSDTDMKTANNAGMYALGVTWGFRDRDDLIKSGAKKLVDEPMEMIALFQ